MIILQQYYILTINSKKKKPSLKETAYKDAILSQLYYVLIAILLQFYFNFIAMTVLMGLEECQILEMALQ